MQSSPAIGREGLVDIFSESDKDRLTLEVGTDSKIGFEDHGAREYGSKTLHFFAELREEYIVPALP